MHLKGSGSRSFSWRGWLAGVLMIWPATLVAVLPILVVLGGPWSGDITVGGSGTSAVHVTADMLPWLWPLSVATTAAGAGLIVGRGYRLGLAVAGGWIWIGAVALAVGGTASIAIWGALLAALIFTGHRSAIAA